MDNVRMDNRVQHLRYDAAGRGAIPRIFHDRAGKNPHGPATGIAGRGHHRGRLPHRLSRETSKATRAVAREIRGCTVAALARARRDDIDAALDGLSGAAHPRLHTFLATSDLHLHHKLRLTREEALEAISTNVRYARERCAEVEFSAEDASRTDIDFLCKAVEAAVNAGATIINLARHGRLCRARGIRGHVPQRHRVSGRRGRDHAERPLPQRPGPGRGQFPGRGPRRARASWN